MKIPNNNKIYEEILNLPWFYTLVQNILAPGSKTFVKEYISSISTQIVNDEAVLDVGCGPSSWLWEINKKPIGVDISYSYCQAFNKTYRNAVVSNGCNLPFSNESFSSVWTVGFLHHISDKDAIAAIYEMMRVCRRNGKVIIIDAVLPRRKWRSPIAYLIRRLDRGKFVRSEDVFQEILPHNNKWTTMRMAYSHTGLEVLICIFEKS